MKRPEGFRFGKNVTVSICAHQRSVRWKGQGTTGKYARSVRKNVATDAGHGLLTSLRYKRSRAAQPTPERYMGAGRQA